MLDRQRHAKRLFPMIDSGGKPAARAGRRTPQEADDQAVSNGAASPSTDAGHDISCPYEEQEMRYGVGGVAGGGVAGGVVEEPGAGAEGVGVGPASTSIQVAQESHNLMCESLPVSSSAPTPSLCQPSTKSICFGLSNETGTTPLVFAGSGTLKRKIRFFLPVPPVVS